MTTLKYVEIDYCRVMHAGFLKDEGVQTTIVAGVLTDKSCT